MIEPIPQQAIIVFFHGETETELLSVILVDSWTLIESILDEYANEYAFERAKLTGVPTLNVLQVREDNNGQDKV